MTEQYRREILDFISEFRGSEDVFLNNCCYWFAFILQARFAAEIFYMPIPGHFVSKIGGDLYDVSGDVTEQYASEPMIAWSKMRDYDRNVYDRVMRDCVYKAKP